MLFVSGIMIAESVAKETIPYRRFIPAGQMTIEGRGYNLLPSKGGSSAGVEATFADASELAAGGRLVKTLEQPLPAGKYLCWIQVQIPKEGRTNGAPISIEAALGKSSQIIHFRERSRTASASAVIDVSETFQTLSVAVRSLEPRLIIDKVYLSNCLEDVRFNPALKIDEIDMDRIWREMAGSVPEESREYPTSASANQLEPANWLHNGSFEVGMGNYEWSTPYQQCYTITPDCWDSTNACDGKSSLRFTFYPSARRWQEDSPSLPAQFTLMHKILKLRPSTTYHFRGMFRSDAPLVLNLSATTAYDSPVPIGGTNVEIGASWRPVELELKTTQDTRGYFLQFVASCSGPAQMWMDACTLSTNKLTAFVPSASVEIGVQWAAPGKLFHADEPAHFTVLAHNYETSNSTAKVTFRYRVMDYFDQLVTDATIKQWSVAGNTTQGKTIDLNKGKTGAFRLLVDGTAQTSAGSIALPLQEYVFSILPRPPAKMHRTFGAYITLAPQPIETMSRAGIRRTVTLSCSNELLQDWSRMEPEPGKFIWVDKRVEDARAHDVGILANIDLAQNASAIPAWARNPKDPADILQASGERMSAPVTFSRKAWANFIETVVSHYKDTIRDWLIVDEPYHYMTPEQYAELIKVTYAAAKRANPSCRILAHGGYYEPWLPAIEKAGAVPFFDGISDYARNRKQGERLKEFATRNHKFVLNVEYLWQVSLYQTIETPGLLMDRTTPWYQEVVDQVTGAISAICWSGSEGFNLYDARYPGGDFTELDKYKCAFEYDGALKPSGVAYAIMANLLDGFHGVDELELNPKLEVYHLEDDARFAIAFRAHNRALLDTTLSLPSGVKAFDFMGNPLSPSPHPMAIPNCGLNYLIGPKSRLDSTRAILKDAVLTEPVTIRGETVLDKNSGQYLLRVTMTNRRKDRSLRGKLKVDPEVLRNFWESARGFSLKPEASQVLTFGLNSYNGDKLDAVTESTIEFFFENSIFKRMISSLSPQGMK